MKSQELKEFMGVTVVALPYLKRNNKMALYAADTVLGRCLVNARSPQQVKKYIREEYGRSVPVLRISRDPEMIKWAKQMGAKVHEVP